MKKVLLKFVNWDIILILKSIAKGKGKTKRGIDGSADVRKDVGLFLTFAGCLTGFFKCLQDSRCNRADQLTVQILFIG